MVKLNLYFAQKLKTTLSHRRLFFLKAPERSTMSRPATGSRYLHLLASVVTTARRSDRHILHYPTSPD